MVQVDGEGINNICGNCNDKSKGTLVLNCFYTNIRSLTNNQKRDEMLALISEHKIDIIGLTESWSHEGILDGELSFEGFNLFRRDRTDGRRGGGVMLLVRDDICAVNMTDMSIGNNESLWVRIKDINNIELCLGVCYRSPNVQDEENKCLMDTIKYFSKDPVIIMGDFNHRDIDWKRLQADSSKGQEFLDVVNDLFLTQHVLQETRGASILDLVFSSEPGLVEDLEICSPVSNSDHNSLLFKICMEIGTENINKEVFNYHQADYEQINLVLEEIDWDEKFMNKDVETMWNELVEKLRECRGKYVPKRKLNKGNYPKWMKNNIKRNIKLRIKLWKRFNDYPTLINETKYNKCRNEINADIRKAKRDFETKLADNIKEDPKSFYAYVRNKSKVKVTIGPLKDNYGNVVSDSKEMADMFNEYFSSVFTKENLNNIPKADNSLVNGKNCSLENIVINQGRIAKALGTLKINKAAGVDELNSSFLKGCANGIMTPLELIFLKSIDTGEIPSDWKQANVSVIFKKGSKKEPGNYRPVSLTCHLGKILEKIIKEDMVKYLEGNKLLFESQHGFRNKKSCLTNLLEFTKYVSDRIDEGKPVDVVYLDFQKAFDKVPHERLIIKLEALGIGGNVIKWIREWLRGRTQRVIINGEESKWIRVTSGVPQGSVLGPVLFLVFINDLDCNIVSKILKFADDAKIAQAVHNVAGRNMLREDLSNLYK